MCCCLIRRRKYTFKQFSWISYDPPALLLSTVCYLRVFLTCKIFAANLSTLSLLLFYLTDLSADRDTTVPATKAASKPSSGEIKPDKLVSAATAVSSTSTASLFTAAASHTRSRSSSDVSLSRNNSGRAGMDACPESPAHFADYKMLSAVLASPMPASYHTQSDSEASIRVNGVGNGGSSSGHGIYHNSAIAVEAAAGTPAGNRVERAAPSSREWYGSDTAHLHTYGRHGNNATAAGFTRSSSSKLSTTSGFGYGRVASSPNTRSSGGIASSSSSSSSRGIALSSSGNGSGVGIASSTGNGNSLTTSAVSAAGGMARSGSDTCFIGIGLFGADSEIITTSSNYTDMGAPGSPTTHGRLRSGSIGMISNPFSPNVNMHSLLIPSPVMSPSTSDIESKGFSRFGTRRSSGSAYNRLNMGIAFSGAVGGVGGGTGQYDTARFSDGDYNSNSLSLSASSTYNIHNQPLYNQTFTGVQACAAARSPPPSEVVSGAYTRSGGSGSGSGGSGGNKRKHGSISNNNNTANHGSGSSKRGTLRKSGTTVSPNSRSPNSTDGSGGSGGKRGTSKTKGKSKNSPSPPHSSVHHLNGDNSYGTPGIGGFRQVSPENRSVAEHAVTVKCNCRKTKCIKLYCDCFRINKLCENCNCTDCSNAGDKEQERLSAITGILERNPEAFAPRIKEDPSSNAKGHLSGCHCKKSACLKKYCECYSAGVPCSDKCRCLDCNNPPGGGPNSLEEEQAHTAAEKKRGKGVRAAGAGAGAEAEAEEEEAEEEEEAGGEEEEEA